MSRHVFLIALCLGLSTAQAEVLDESGVQDRKSVV